MTETVLITGASSGIGRELARHFATSGSRLVLVARRSDRLTELAGELPGDAQVITCDLAARDAAANLEAKLRERALAVDVLVNNAGSGLHGAFQELDTSSQMQMIRLNVLTLTELTHRLLPAMLERRRGGLLNVASTAAFQAGPKMAVYYATKAYVLSLSEALHEELRGSGVTVTCLCPGATKTEFAAAAGMQETRLFRTFAQSVDTAARAGFEGFRKGRPVVIPGLVNKLGVFSVRLAPRGIPRRVVSWLQ